MQKFGRMPKPIIFLFMAGFIFMPLFDAVSCDDCAVFAKSPRPEIVSVNESNADGPTLIEDIDSAKGMSAAQNEAGDLCPLCSNTPQTPNNSESNPLISVAGVNKTILIPHVDPSFPISKPPQI